jgi:Family of unknown function (DUF6441)
VLVKLAASITRSLQADMQAAKLRDIERALATGTRDAGRGLRTELRRQVGSAGLGQRLANSWRDKHYPNQGRDPLAPLQDVITDEGDIVVPVDPRYLGLWLTGLFGDPDTTDNLDRSWDHEFTSGGDDLPSYTVESACPTCRHSSATSVSSWPPRARYRATPPPWRPAAIGR